MFSKYFLINIFVYIFEKLDKALLLLIHVKSENDFIYLLL